MKKIVVLVLGLIFSLFLLNACSTTNIDCSYDGVQALNGNPIAHVCTSNSSLTFLGTYPIVGDADMKKTFDDFKREARRLGGSKVNVVYSKKNINWFSLPPISWLFPQVVSSVSGDVYP